MVDSRIGAFDALNGVASDLRGASDALCLCASTEGNDLAGMVSRVLDVDVDVLQEIAEWLSA